MNIRGRKAQADGTAARLREMLDRDRSLEIREALCSAARAGDERERSCSPRFRTHAGRQPPDRVAGAIAVTDGEVHDAPDSSKPPCMRRFML